ncbi:MAG: RNA polymerase sigma factor [Polyangiaceae bacterium]|nr:RNA polymerase sigma factor [Polyangiaceae bacterium]
MTRTEPFSNTYQRLSPGMRARCRRMLGSDAAAEDVVQETFARLWQEGPDPEANDGRTIGAWLHRTSTRLALDALRGRRRAPLVDPSAVDASAAPDTTHAVEARQALVAIARGVPNDELEVAWLTRIDGLSHPEAAIASGVSERSVRRMLTRFDAKIRLLMAAIVLALVMLFSGRACANEAPIPAGPTYGP